MGETLMFGLVPLPLNSTIGILGGGQLGMFLAHSAHKLGYKTSIFTNNPEDPALRTSPSVVAPYTDTKKLTRWLKKVDVVTFEFENIDSSALDVLAKSPKVRPSVETIRVCNDRIAEKSFLNKHEIPTTVWRIIESKKQLQQIFQEDSTPWILKTAKWGYDGKGQSKCDTFEQAWQHFKTWNKQPCVAEKIVDFKCEASVIVARNLDGEIVSFPVVKNTHENHILKTTIAPALLGFGLDQQCQEISVAIAEHIDLVGVLAVEMFVTKDGDILVNELAPRPHNSGHWTMDGCNESQFDLHIRAIASLPLNKPQQLHDCVMQNLIGPTSWDNYTGCLLFSKFNTYWYGKPITDKPGRKMGHVTQTWPLGHFRNMDYDLTFF